MMNEQTTFIRPESGDISTETFGRPIDVKPVSHNLGDGGSNE